jgi:hypothetical protein
MMAMPKTGGGTHAGSEMQILTDCDVALSLWGTFNAVCTGKLEPAVPSSHLLVDLLPIIPHHILSVSRTRYEY